MNRAYRFVLLLYPRGVRDQFADEMTGVFEQASRDARSRGWAWYFRFSFGEFAGLIGGAASAWSERRVAPPAPATASTAVSAGLPPEIVAAQERVQASIAGMIHAIANHQFERARVLSDEERRARAKLRAVREKYGITD